jgi:anti-sigma B factor antagonist
MGRGIAVKMELIVEEIPNGITKAALIGRMDIEGAASVDMRMNVLAGAKRILLVDLSEVSFMASMGLRTLMVCARAMTTKGRKMALIGPQANVEKVLLSSGANEVIPIFGTFDLAVEAVQA